MNAAAKDAQTDAALARLPSPYPMVTPASSVFEVLGFAAQTRHAENYATIMASAAAHGSLETGEVLGSSIGGSGGSGGGGDGTEGLGISGSLFWTPTKQSEGPAGSPRANPVTPIEEGSKAVAAAASATVAAAGAAAAAAAAAAGAAAHAIVDHHGGSGAGAKDSDTEAKGQSNAAVTLTPSAGSDGEGSSKAHGGGMSAIFAAAAAALGAADSRKTPLASRSSSSTLLSVPPTTTARVLLPEPSADATDVGAVTSDAGAAVSASPTPSAPPGSVSNAVGNDSSKDASYVATIAQGSGGGSREKVPVSPCLLLVTEQPSVFAATLADDVLESLYVDVARVIKKQRSDDCAEEVEGAEGGGSCVSGEGDCGIGGGDSATAVARAVEALLGGGIDGAAGEVDREVDAAAKVRVMPCVDIERFLAELALATHGKEPRVCVYTAVCT